MNEPRWDDSKLRAGTMVRGALWLVQEVGEGGIYTKERLRSAFPGVAQADRRLRDLRKYGWILDTSVTDASLAADEQRFVKRGASVWDAGDRRAVGPVSGALSSKERAQVLAASHYQCDLCGIAGGESYQDRPTETAVLSVRRRRYTGLSGVGEELLVTECKRCQAAPTGKAYSPAAILSALKALDEDDLNQIRRWMAKGSRSTTPLDRAWVMLVSFPLEVQRSILSKVD